MSQPILSDPPGGAERDPRTMKTLPTTVPQGRSLPPDVAADASAAAPDSNAEDLRASNPSSEEAEAPARDAAGAAAAPSLRDGEGDAGTRDGGTGDDVTGVMPGASGVAGGGQPQTTGSADPPAMTGAISRRGPVPEAEAADGRRPGVARADGNWCKGGAPGEQEQRGSGGGSGGPRSGSDEIPEPSRERDRDSPPSVPLTGDGSGNKEEEEARAARARRPPSPPAVERAEAAPPSATPRRRHAAPNLLGGSRGSAPRRLTEAADWLHRGGPAGPSVVPPAALPAGPAAAAHPADVPGNPTRTRTHHRSFDLHSARLRPSHAGLDGLAGAAALLDGGGPRRASVQFPLGAVAETAQPPAADPVATEAAAAAATAAATAAANASTVAVLLGLGRAAGEPTKGPRLAAIAARAASGARTAEERARRFLSAFHTAANGTRVANPFEPPPAAVGPQDPVPPTAPFGAGGSASAAPSASPVGLPSEGPGGGGSILVGGKGGHGSALSLLDPGASTAPGSTVGVSADGEAPTPTPVALGGHGHHRVAPPLRPASRAEAAANRLAARNRLRAKRQRRLARAAAGANGGVGGVKPVRYESRRRLAEQRPRFRGQFVTQETAAALAAVAMARSGGGGAMPKPAPPTSVAAAGAPGSGRVGGGDLGRGKMGGIKGDNQTEKIGHCNWEIAPPDGGRTVDRPPRAIRCCRPQTVVIGALTGRAGCRSPPALPPREPRFSSGVFPPDSG